MSGTGTADYTESGPGGIGRPDFLCLPARWVSVRLSDVLHISVLCVVRHFVAPASGRTAVPILLTCV